MNLNARATRLENALFGVSANPLQTGAYTFYGFTKLNDEYEYAMIRAGTPVEFAFYIGPDALSRNDLYGPDEISTHTTPTEEPTP